MATKLDIINAALTKLGLEPIATLSDNTKRAKQADTNYERLKRKLLRQHPWNFAKKRIELTADVGSSPVYGFNFQYSLPSDFLRLLQIESSYEDHAIEGDKLFYNDGEKINIQYVHDAAEALFDTDPLFEDLLAITLAHELSYGLVQNQSLKEQLAGEMARLMAESRLINAQSRGTPQDLGGDGLIIARL